MHQKKYISEVLKKFNKMECNPAETPTELNVKLVRSENETLVYGTLFKQIVGSLRFICHSRPKIAFRVGLVSRFTSDPRQQHLLATKTILSLKKQTVVTLSTGKAEYIAMCSTACQALWLTSLLNELKVSVGNVVDLLVDNKSTIALAKNPVSHGRSKHIDTKFHFLRDQVNKGKVKLKHCKIEVQLADIMTKSLKIERFKKLRGSLNIVCF
ncbi:hypothetical protein JHK82_038393 [Glycine max]|nr:hypothetical protein JHK86_038575 [Glycine max]KAG5109170.1 hypothetical protein JHK82_038393 [Glycine max]KAG5120454.1 hypothetical protein JHK84_038794 [Glycine max]